jgi:hypothetical protein
MLNLDTHIPLNALSGDLTEKENKLLSTDQWCISEGGLTESRRETSLRSHRITENPMRGNLVARSTLP